MAARAGRLRNRVGVDLLHRHVEVVLARAVREDVRLDPADSRFDAQARQVVCERQHHPFVLPERDHDLEAERLSGRLVDPLHVLQDPAGFVEQVSRLDQRLPVAAVAVVLRQRELVREHAFRDVLPQGFQQRQFRR